jgi:hypothetical protein
VEGGEDQFCLCYGKGNKISSLVRDKKKFKYNINIKWMCEKSSLYTTQKYAANTIRGLLLCLARRRGTENMQNNTETGRKCPGPGKLAFD